MIINKEEYESMVSNCIEVYRENSNRLKDISYSELSKLFKRFFPEKTFSKYKKNTVSKILQNENILEILSINDLKSIAGIIPEIMDKSASFKQKVLDKILFFDIKNKATRLKFSELIKEYESILAKKNQSESVWQNYLRRNILFLNSSYLDILEKKILQ